MHEQLVACIELGPECDEEKLDQIIGSFAEISYQNDVQLARCKADLKCDAETLYAEVYNQNAFDKANEIIALLNEAEHKSGSNYVDLLTKLNSNTIDSVFDLAKDESEWKARNCSSIASAQCKDDYETYALDRSERLYNLAQGGAEFLPINDVIEVYKACSSDGLASCGANIAMAAGGPIFDGAKFIYKKGDKVYQGIVKQGDDGIELVDQAGNKFDDTAEVMTNSPETHAKDLGQNNNGSKVAGSTSHSSDSQAGNSAKIDSADAGNGSPPLVQGGYVKELGVIDDSAFAQVKSKGTKAFSEYGQDIYSKLAGQKITTVDDLANALISGLIKPSQVPLDYVILGGQRVIANTRTSTALRNAVMPKSHWFGVNKTGVKAFVDINFDKPVQDQLDRNYGGSVNNARK